MAESSDLPLTLQMGSCSLSACPQDVGDGRAWHDKRSKDRTKRNFIMRSLKTNGGLILGFYLEAKA